MTRLLGALALLALAPGCALLSPPDALSDQPAVAAVHSATAGPLRVGAAVVDITPLESQWIAGYGLFRDSVGVHDPILARALALERGDLRVLIVGVDVIGLQQHTVEAVRDRLAARLPREAVWVAATHNHEGPDTMGLWGVPPLVSGIDWGYLDRALEGIARAGELALDRLEPATLRWGQAEAPARGVSQNKREPDLIDRTVTALAFDRPDGSPLATLVHFACHPELLGGNNPLISADYPARTCAVLEEARPGAPAIFLNGALGGMITGHTRDRTFAEVERVGREVGLTALEALERGHDAPAELELACAQLLVEAPIQNRRYFLGSLFGIFGDREFTWDGYTRTEVGAIRLGDVVLLTAPGEALPRVGFELEALVGGREPFLLVGLGNDELGYLIHEQDFERELYAYERTVSPGPLVTTLLRDLAARALDLVGAR